MILLNAAPLILLVGFCLFLMRQMQAGGNKALSFGKSRARLLSAQQKKATFKDVAGTDEAKEELQEIIEFLKDPQKFQKLGGRIPKGVLLVGPPGTGKTLLARAIAGEANVPFFSISGSDFVEMFVGVGASRVRDLFEQGKKNAPCIIFIDEIDAVGRHRGAGLGGGHDEREQTLNALLVEMDGFESNEGVILIAATNRPDVLDGNASSRKISRPGLAIVGWSNVPTFRIIKPGRVPGSSAIDEPHSGQKCLRIGLPLPPMLLNVLSVPSKVTASLARSNQRGKSAAGELLAIPAMANCCACWVDFGCIAYRAAEATSFDLHLDSP